MKTCKHVFASLALWRFPGRGICPDACVRQAKAYRLVLQPKSDVGTNYFCEKPLTLPATMYKVRGPV